MARYRFAIAFAFALGSLLAACGPQTYIIQQYDGPVREVESIAILRINGDDSVRIVSLDGDHADPRLEDDTRLHIELLPGRHTVRVASATLPGANPQSLSFEAEAGRVYRAVLQPFDFNGRPTASGAPRLLGSVEADVFEVERGNDRPVRNVTVRLPAPLPAPPPVVAAPPPRPVPILGPDPVSPPEVPPPAPSPSLPLPPLP